MSISFCKFYPCEQLPFLTVQSRGLGVHEQSREGCNLHVLDLQVKSVAATELEADALVLPDQEAASADDASRLVPHDYELAQSVHGAG